MLADRVLFRDLTNEGMQAWTVPSGTGHIAGHHATEIMVCVGLLGEMQKRMEHSIEVAEEDF